MSELRDLDKAYVAGELPRAEYYALVFKEHVRMSAASKVGPCQCLCCTAVRANPLAFPLEVQA